MIQISLGNCAIESIKKGTTMTSFVHTEYPTSHPGVTRFESAFATLKVASQSLTGSRGLATLLLAAMVSALLVVANEVIETVTEGHLFAAWIGLWTIAFAALALFAAPARQIAGSLREGWAAWRVARKAAAADERLWAVALQDARIMADINAAMTRAADAAELAKPIAAATVYSADAARGHNTDDEIKAFSARHKRMLAARNGY
jgi:hypothetical protein